MFNPLPQLLERLDAFWFPHWSRRTHYFVAIVGVIMLIAMIVHIADEICRKIKRWLRK